MLDFNDIPPAAGGPVDLNAQRDELKRELLARLPAVLMALFPAGKIRGNKFLIGNIQGEPGDSLEIALDGDKAGLCTTTPPAKAAMSSPRLPATRAWTPSATSPPCSKPQPDWWDGPWPRRCPPARRCPSMHSGPTPPSGTTSAPPAS